MFAVLVLVFHYYFFSLLKGRWALNLGGGAYKWELGAYKQQFTMLISLLYLYTNKVLM